MVEPGYDVEIGEIRSELGLRHRDSKGKMVQDWGEQQPTYDPDIKNAIRITSRAFRMTDAGLLRMAIYRHFFNVWTHVSAMLEKKDVPKWKRDRFGPVLAVARWVIDAYEPNLKNKFRVDHKATGVKQKDWTAISIANIKVARAARYNAKMAKQEKELFAWPSQS